MKVSSPSPVQNISHQRSYVLAILSLLILMSILLGMNYYAQKQAQLRTIERIQSDVDAEATRFAMLIDRLQSELHQLAASQEVNAYFRNKALGMSMEYGLRASLNNITYLFDRQLKQFPFGGTSIFEHISIFDCSGELLASMPEPQNQSVQRSKVSCQEILPNQSFSNNGILHLQAPVMSDNKRVATMHAEIPYTRIHNHLATRISSGSHSIILHNNLVADPPLDNTPPEFLNLTTRQLGNKEPLLLSVKDPLLIQIMELWRIDHPLLFKSSINGFSMTLLRIESAGDIYDKTAPITILVVMILFSSVIVIFSFRLIHSASRNAALNHYIHELSDSADALREKNQEMNLIIEGAKIGTWAWDVSTGKLQVNNTWSQMLGYKSDELPPHVTTWEERLHPDEVSHVFTAVNDHLAGKSSIYITDHRLRHASGDWIWVRAVGQVFSRDQYGNPVQVKGIHLEITELKNSLLQTEQAQREADSVIANFLDSLLVVDCNLIIRRINKATCALLNYQEKELLGRHVSFLFSDPQTYVSSCFNIPIGNDSPNESDLRNIEMTLQCANGNLLPVSVNLARLKDQHGKTIGIVAGAKDVSALKNALVKTERQHQFIERIFNIVPGGLLVMDADYSILHHNDTYGLLINDWCQTYQIDKESLHRLIQQKMSELLPNHKSGHFSIHSTTSEFFIEFHAAKERTKHHNNWVIYLHDVTSKLQAESVHRLHSTVLEQTTEAVVVSDKKGRFRYVNKAFTSLSGYSLSEIIGRPVSLLKTGTYQKSFYVDLTKTLKSGNVWSGSMAYRHKNHSLFETDTSISPIRNDSGEIICYVSLWRDVSHERILQRQLLQAQKLEAVGQLAAGIAHELNTPIQYIQNNMSFIQDSFTLIHPLINRLQQLRARPVSISDSTWQAQLAKEIVAADLDFIYKEIPKSIIESMQGIGHVVRIVSAMKELSHPGQIDKLPTDFNRLIDNATIVTRNEWKYVATLTTDLDPDLPPVVCDSGTWGQILLNLIVNSAQAIEATHRADGALGNIHIMTRTQGQTLILTIRDDGIGIADKHLDRIFEPFFTTKEVGKGTGQGLSIVYDLVVNKHQGQITCDSTAGQGCSFTLKVPLA